MAENFTPLQAAPFLLAGSGAIIGDTTLTLQSFTRIDGTPITMAMLGLSAYMTLEPGNGTQEEQIVFTDVIQNTNGTATLTGVSDVTMQYPYTQTSGLLITHAGSTTAILSNTSGFYARFVAKDDDGTITETLTFTQPNFPQMDGVVTPPSLPAQLVTKAYADSLTFAGAPNASTSVKGIVQIATQAQTDARTLIGSTSAVLVSPPTNQRSTLLSDYVIDTSTSPNVIIITPSPAITSYQTGQQFSFKLANTNTSPTVTLNINGLGAKNISTLSGTTSPSMGDLIAGGMIIVEYDGTNFQVQTLPVQQLQPTGSIIMFGGSTAPNNWLLCNGSPVSRATFSTLFSIIGTSFGSGDGMTTFNVPAMGGRFIAGPSPSLSTIIGATGGAASTTTTVVFPEISFGPTGGGSGYVGTAGSLPGSITATTSPIITIPPYIITNYIIRT